MKFSFKHSLSWALAWSALTICLASPGMAATSAEPHKHGSATAVAAPASDASQSIQPFDEKTWPAILRTGPRPAAYLFTTSYCSSCPAAFEVLHRAVKSQKTRVELVAVMMDVDGAQARRHAAHFSGLTHMYAFDGFEPAIRQSVDPSWPNVTPYVVMVDRVGQTQKVIGQPSKAALRQWLR